MDGTIPARYCSTIQLYLVVHGQSHELSKVQSDRVYFRRPVCLPQCDAEVVMDVDGELRIWNVRLPYGAVEFDDEVPVLLH